MSSPSSEQRSLADVVRAIQTDADAIQEFLDAQQQQQQQQQRNRSGGDAAEPTVSYGGLEVGLPPELEQKKLNLLDAAEEINFRLRSPVAHVCYKFVPSYFFSTFIVQAIEKYQIATNLAPDETISFAELAQRCHLDTQDLTHLLSGAISHRIFEHAGDSRVRHNAASLAIAQSEDLRSTIHVTRTDILPGCSGYVDALGKFPGALKANQTGWSLAHNTNLSMFEQLGQDNEFAAHFSAAMRTLGTANRPEFPQVAETLGLGEMQGTIVDVGGSTGSLMFAILRAAPSMKGVVQDLPNVIAHAAVPSDLQDRLTFKASDFFKEQQEKGADVYIFRKILHDWSDAQCAVIIKQTIPALKPGARIILNELCLPDPGAISMHREQEYRGWDLSMKALTNGIERTQSEWIALFHGVDPRLEFRGVQKVPGAASGLIEFAWT